MPFGKELLFQLLSRLGAETPPNEMRNPITALLNSDGYVPEDEPYLRQYMGIPKNGGLIPQEVRPTRLGIDLAAEDGLPWYRPANSPIDKILTKAPRGIGEIPKTTAIAAGDIANMGAGDVIGLRTPMVPGLGHYKASVGKGKSGRPYLSVYDKWDFDSPVITPLIQQLMNRAGQGFHTYERYPLTQTPSGSYQVGGDIYLPKEQ